MSRPDHTSDNYDWALWHLEKSEHPNTGQLESEWHLKAAQVRATLALVTATSDGYFSGSAWSGGDRGE